jgi:ATP citrate (pro-S)-lyase
MLATRLTFPGCLFWRSAYESSMDALRQPTIRVVAVIAEGVPEGDTKKLIAYARANNKILIGPATVGGVQVCGLLPWT